MFSKLLLFIQGCLRGDPLQHYNHFTMGGVGEQVNGRGTHRSERQPFNPIGWSSTQTIKYTTK